MAGEDLYARGVTAERQTKYKTAVRCYATAADLGVPCAAYAVCRCMEKSGARQGNPELYEFWLATASRTDPIAAGAYSAYLRRVGDERGALRYLRQAADRGHEDSARKLAVYYLRHGDRPAARYYIRRSSGFRAACLRLILGREKAVYEPQTPELPDETVELYKAGTYALELELPHIAYSYFEEAAQASYLPAVEKAAEMCMRGHGTERNEEKVQKYLLELGEAGQTEAFIRLGDYFINGIFGSEPNPVAAWKLYQRAAEAGNAEGMVLLGDCLYDGNGVNRDAHAALAWYDRAAKAGSQTGAQRAARMREEALTLYTRAEKNLEQGQCTGALELLNRAAELGHAEANSLLGDCYLGGRGVKASPKRAAEHYRLAAEDGSARAMYRLGTLYLMNMGVRFDARRAQQLLEQAHLGGYHKAEEKLEELKARQEKYLADKLYSLSCVIYHRGDSREAARFRAAAAKKGQPRATYLLGCMYDCGDGVEKDASHAYALYEKARTLGFDGKARGYMSKYLHQLHLREGSAPTEDGREQKREGDRRASGASR
jgi:hypothetical protein